MKNLNIFLFVIVFPSAQLFSQDFDPTVETLINLNSPFNEDFLHIHPDGNTLAFSRANHPYNQGGKEDNGDIWFSVQDSAWQLPKDWHAVNNEHITSPLGWTSDGKVFLYNLVRTTGGTLHTEVRALSGGRSQTVDIPYLKNRSSHQSGCLSLDGKVIILSMESANTYGVEDLYAILWDGERWSAPRNLGKTINSPYQEITPFLSPDMRTLYFATNGRDGQGSFDIYASERLDDSWREWSTPRNLGEEVNTSGRETSFVFAPGAQYAYFVSTRNSDGYGDIRRVKFAVPDTTAQVAEVDTAQFRVQEEVHVMERGLQLFNAKTSAPLSQTEVTIEGEILRSDERGRVEPSAVGVAKVEIQGFLTQSVTLTDALQEVWMEPLEVGRTIRLDNVLFRRSASDILESSFEELDKVVDMMNQNPNMRILLKGHTDGMGDPAQNLKLSEQRVDAVRQYLVSKGIKKNRIQGKGLGGEEPIASNATEETRKLNRRVEFEIIEQ